LEISLTTINEWINDLKCVPNVKKNEQGKSGKLWMPLSLLPEAVKLKPLKILKIGLGELKSKS